MYRPDFVLYHHPCSDGLTAAAIIFNFYKDNGEGHNPIFREADYAKINVEAMIEEFRDKHILLVDFSFKKPVLEALQQVVKSLVILDHHKTALADLDDFQYYDEGDRQAIVDLDINSLEKALKDQIVIAVFNMDQSGASLTYKFFNPGKEVPIFVQYVKDIDIAQHKLERNRDFQWYSRSIPFNVEEMAGHINTTKEALYKNFDDGKAIKKFVDTRINILKQQVKYGEIGTARFGFVISDYAFCSETANVIVNEFDVDFGVVAYFTGTGMGFSLRSIAPFDCSAIAKQFGGGGHAQASGFNIPFSEVGDFIDSLLENNIVGSLTE